MAKYDAQAELAHRMVSAKGRLVTFTRRGATVDPVSQQSSGADTTYTAHVLAVPLSAGKARYLFGEGADITKKRLSLSIALKGVTQEILPGDRFAWSGVDYSVLSVEALDPAGEGAIYASGYAEAA